MRCVNTAGAGAASRCAPAECLAAVREGRTDRRSGLRVDPRISGALATGLATSPLQVRLQPQLVDAATEGRQRVDQPGAEIYGDPVFCSAVSCVDAPLQRKLIGRGYFDLSDVVIRPAVVVDTDSGDCAVLTDVVAEAARLYG